MNESACVEAPLAVPKVIDFAGATAVITGAQIRAARALLRWRVVDLAEKAGLSFAALQRAEATDEIPRMQTRNLAAIKTAFENAGVVFLDGDYSGRGGPGVRLREPK
jgi:hypothetical protein